MTKKRHLVITVEDSTPCVNIFKTKKSMDKFLEQFSKKHPDEHKYYGYWIDLVVTDVSGSIISDGRIIT